MDKALIIYFYAIPMILSMIFLLSFLVLMIIEYRDDSLYENKTRQCAMRILPLLSVICAIIPIILVLISILVNL
jgi:hypothetical protein